MTARLLIGDTRRRIHEIDDHSIDFLVTSPPFLALRSYLPDSHPDKHLEIGSEATPAAYLDVLLELTAEWGRVLAPHGSIAVELGDTYAGSGGAGGDYDPDGLRAGQPGFDGSASRLRIRTDYDADYDKSQRGKERGGTGRWGQRFENGGSGWPLPKSLACIPQLYQVALAYGRNPLRAPLSARELLGAAEMLERGSLFELNAGQLLEMLKATVEAHEERFPVIEYERWRVRTLKPWIRSNPPVGALGDKERPATSYVIVACRASDRWFDLDAVRTAPQGLPRSSRELLNRGEPGYHTGDDDSMVEWNPGGAPPRDWWHHVDAVLDACLDELGNRSPRLGGPTGGKAVAETAPRDHGNVVNSTGWVTGQDRAVRGVHLRRALERAGILTTQEALDVSPRGYTGAHYAVWPPELVRQLVDEMCPRKVCTTCGQPSRRITEPSERYASRPNAGRDFHGPDHDRGRGHASRTERRPGSDPARQGADYVTLGWSDCGHGTWRPGHILDPFAGSGTTLSVATGMARDCTGIDIDMRNAVLTLERAGMLLEIDWGEPDLILPTLPAGDPTPGAYAAWITDQQARAFLTALVDILYSVEPDTPMSARRSRTVAQLPGQIGMFLDIDERRTLTG